MSTEFKDFPLDMVGRGVGLTGAIYTDERTGDSYVFRFPDYADDDFNPRLIHPLTTEDWKALVHQTDLIEMPVVVKDQDGKLYKAVLRKCQRRIAQGVSWNVYKRDDYTCRYCGRDGLPLTVDHLILWEDGGPSTEDNLLTACRKCNKTRGNTPYAKWLRHRYYKRVSNALSSEQFQANEAIVHRLDRVERVHQQRSR